MRIVRELFVILIATILWLIFPSFRVVWRKHWAECKERIRLEWEGTREEIEECHQRYHDAVRRMQDESHTWPK